jgi:hypothetical protein
MEGEDVLSLIPSAVVFAPIFQYAETHYRFPFFFSYLKKNEPELIADAPFRLNPGERLPVFLIVNESHRYPCRIERVRITLSQDQQRFKEHDVLTAPIELHQPFWWKLVELDVDGHSGWIEADVQFEIEVRGVKRSYRNDNYRTTSHKPLRIFVAHDRLPCFDDMLLGDMHCHSVASFDQVEFGAPPEAMVAAARALGMSFFGITDHSYDLDDSLDDYLTNDPALPKWHAQQLDIDAANARKNGFTILRGEEVSCRNELGKNVHLLLYGNRTFIPGSGDSAERWLRTRSEHSISEVLKMKEAGAVAFASHPCEDIPKSQRLLLGRGVWSAADLSNDQLAGYQLVNGSFGESFQRIYKQWIKQLLMGKRMSVVGGTDAHGNFNRYRQIMIPFFKIAERDKQIFGQIRTGIFSSDRAESAILQALSAGKTIVSDGPVLKCTVESRGDRKGIVLEGRSSSEFGKFETVHIMSGHAGAKEEEKITVPMRDIEYTFRFSIEKQLKAGSYIRCAATTSAENIYDGKPHYCYISPVWL